MARPKERMKLPPVHQSPAFVEKCVKEKQHLQTQTAEQLKEDILRLFTEEIHTDVTVVSGTKNIKAHSVIIYARTGNYFLLPAKSTTSENIVLKIGGLQGQDGYVFLKQLYITENVNLLLEEYKENLIKCEQVKTSVSPVAGFTKTEGEKEVQNELQEERQISSYNTKLTEFTLDGNSLALCDRTVEFQLNCQHTDVSSHDDKYSKDISDDNDKNKHCEDTSKNSREADVQDSEMNLCLKDMEPQTENCSTSNYHHSLTNISVDESLSKSSDPKLTSIPTVEGHSKSSDLDLNRINFDEGHSESSDHNLTIPSIDDSHSKSSDHVLANVSTDHRDFKSSMSHNKLQPNSEESDKVATSTNVTLISLEDNFSLEHVRNKDKFNNSVNGRDDSLSENSKDKYEACSSLGQNLISLYLEEWGSDQEIIVSGHVFKTHKCILAARSAYFSAMFGGSWSESCNSCINLEGVSANVFEQALLYLYGGVIQINKSCPLSELLLVSDMYGIEGLKDVVSFHLRKEYCHFFHKPCTVCSSTLAEALMLSVSFHLDDIEERCFKVLAKSFTKFWATKSFAGLPDEIMQLSCDYIASHLTEKTVIETILDCHKLSNSLPRVKWAESVLHWTNKLLELAIEYTSQHFVDVVGSEQFLSWGRRAAWSGSFLDEIFRTVIDSLPTEKACGSYRALLRLHEFNTSQEDQIYGEDVTHLLRSLISHCESYIKVYIHQVTQTAEWQLLPEDIKTKILQSSSFVCIDPYVKGKGANIKQQSVQKGRVSAAFIQALKEDNSFRQKRSKLNKTILDKSSNRGDQDKTKQKLSSRHHGSDASENKKTGDALKTQNLKHISSAGPNNTQRTRSSRADEEILNFESQKGTAREGKTQTILHKINVNDSVAQSFEDICISSVGTRSSKTRLRPAKSTGSLSTSTFGMSLGNRSVSTENIDVDSWGFTRQPVPSHSLETLVPIFETTFCKPCDLGDF